MVRYQVRGLEIKKEGVNIKMMNMKKVIFVICGDRLDTVHFYKSVLSVPLCDVTEFSPFIMEQFVEEGKFIDAVKNAIQIGKQENVLVISIVQDLRNLLGPKLVSTILEQDITCIYYCDHPAIFSSENQSMANNAQLVLKDANECDIPDLIERVKKLIALAPDNYGFVYVV